MKLINKRTITFDLSADVSEEVDVEAGSMVSVQAISAATGTHVGTLYVEEGNDGTNYSPITGLSSTLASGVAMSDFLTHPACCSSKLRLRYARTSGTGSLVLTVIVKG